MFTLFQMTGSKSSDPRHVRRGTPDTYDVGPLTRTTSELSTRTIFKKISVRTINIGTQFKTILFSLNLRGSCPNRGTIFRLGCWLAPMVVGIFYASLPRTGRVGTSVRHPDSTANRSRQAHWICTENRGVARRGRFVAQLGLAMRQTLLWRPLSRKTHDLPPQHEGSAEFDGGGLLDLTWKGLKKKQGARGMFDETIALLTENPAATPQGNTKKLGSPLSSLTEEQRRRARETRKAAFASGKIRINQWYKDLIKAKCRQCVGYQPHEKRDCDGFADYAQPCALTPFRTLKMQIGARKAALKAAILAECEHCLNKNPLWNCSSPNCPLYPAFVKPIHDAKGWIDGYPPEKSRDGAADAA